jgi:hypothetical protein
MDTTSGTVTVWQSGRLAPQRVAPRLEFSREQWLVTALLVLSAIVLTLFVGVLRNDVAGGDLQHLAQRARPALAMTLDNTPDKTAGNSSAEQENAAWATTVSLLTAR